MGVRMYFDEAGGAVGELTHMDEAGGAAGELTHMEESGHAGGITHFDESGHADEITHLDEAGHAAMVDVSGKAVTVRQAVASGVIKVNAAVMGAILEGTVPKGDVFSVARVAGIMAAKKTFELIPLCHPLPITKVSVNFETDADAGMIRAICTARVVGPTGVEMEALTGASVALLTIYDMCKAIDKTMEITAICLEEKYGGKSGEYHRA